MTDNTTTDNTTTDNTTTDNTTTDNTTDVAVAAPKLTKAQSRALEIIGDGRKSGGFWRDMGISYKTLNALYDMDMLLMEMNGHSQPSKWVYWKA